MKSNATILHEVTPEEINSLFKELQNQIIELKNSFEPKKPVELLTRTQVSKMLDCDLSTIYNWCKKGKLKPYGIGNRIYFKRSDIEAVLIPLGNKIGGKDE